MRKFLNYFYLKVKLDIELIIYRPIVLFFQYKKIRSLSKKKKIKVAFFVIHESVWKYDVIYNKMINSSRFDPVIVICPYIEHGDDSMLATLNNAYEYFLSKGYNVVNSYNKIKKKWININKEISPDIIFFTNPHFITNKKYYIYRYISKLTCYTQYSFHITHLNEMQYNQIFHNLLWRAYYETPVHLSMAKKYSRIKAKNVRITGYPGLDRLLYPEEGNGKKNTSWKIENRKIKRIIWAPHHTIEDNEKSLLGWSCFLSYAEVMLAMLDRFKDDLQICFKPHPLLRGKLEKIWSKVRVNKYYEEWSCAENGQLLESDYVECFISSDAMIHDSGSFLVEYLCVNKPSLFTVRNKDFKETFNEFGKKAIEHHYLAYSEKDIVRFIENIIEGFDDYKKPHRLYFVSKFLKNSKKNTASDNIYNDIILSLQNRK